MAYSFPIGVQDVSLSVTSQHSHHVSKAPPIMLELEEGILSAWLLTRVFPHMQTIPVISALALFGTIAIVCCIIISLGPIAHVEQNSKTYSAIAPPR